MQTPVINTQAEITKIQPINHDCYIFTLSFLTEVVELSIGKHIRLYQNIKTQKQPEGQIVMRKYTPINPCSQKNPLEILIKIYRPTPQFPEGGKLTTYLEKCKVGDKLTVEGPYGNFDYKTGGIISTSNITGQITTKQYKRIFFIGGGSGITPIYQSMMEIVKLKEQTIEMILLFANKTEQDIVLRKEFEEKSDRIKTHYILDTPPEGWKHFKGYITHEILKEICPLDSPETLYVFCGPPPMNKFIRQLFGKNYPQSILYKF